MKIFSMTDVGMIREINEDRTFISGSPVGRLPNLLVIADGMGGHRAGEYASKLAVEAVRDALAGDKRSDPKAMLRDAVNHANLKLLEEATKDASFRGMGTTLVAATIIKNTLYFANVGDSRLYLVHEDIKQLSRDHSLVQEMLRLGGINREEARRHPDKHIITRAVGANPKLEVDIFEYRLRKGDIILMCTDGLSNMVEDEDIFRIVTCSRDVTEAVSRLIDKANSNGGCDNIGVIVADPFADEVNV